MEKLTFPIFFFFSFFSKRTDRNITSQSRHCPPYFDGLLCWPYTKPSDIAILPCPSETGPLNQLDPATNSALNSDTPVATMATKTCLSNGQWGSNSENIRESNYSLCKLSDEFIDRLLVNLGFRIVLFRDYKNFESLLNVRNFFLKILFLFFFFKSIVLNRIFTFRQKWLPIVRIVSQIGYSTSFAMLITAMIIFSLLRYVSFSLSLSFVQYCNTGS